MTRSPEALRSSAYSASECLCFSQDGTKQNSVIEKEGYGNMSRKTLVTLLLIFVTALLAVALFIAGAIWRGRVTARSAATDSRNSLWLLSIRKQSEEASDYVHGSADP